MKKVELSQRVEQVHPKLSSYSSSSSVTSGYQSLLSTPLVMQLEDIYQFFQNPPPTFLVTRNMSLQEQAVCYVLSVLLQEDSYGTELIERVEKEYPNYRLSDTILYTALKFLEDERVIAGYWQKIERRGRPRRMYRVNLQWLRVAQELARLWRESAKPISAKLPSTKV